MYVIYEFVDEAQDEHKIELVLLKVEFICKSGLEVCSQSRDF